MVSTDSPIKYTPWTPETDPIRQKTLNKLNEEAGELISASARCLMQGIDGHEPETLKPNKEWLEDELADVWACFQGTIKTFKLDLPRIIDRANKKMAYLENWKNDGTAVGAQNGG